MTTLGDIINKIAAIRNEIDAVEVKGYDNRRRLNAAYDNCTDLINEINQTAQEIQNGSNSEEG